MIFKFFDFINKTKTKTLNFDFSGFLNYVFQRWSNKEIIDSAANRPTFISAAKHAANVQNLQQQYTKCLSPTNTVALIGCSCIFLSNERQKNHFVRKCNDFREHLCHGSWFN